MVTKAVRNNNPGCIRDKKVRWYFDTETNSLKIIQSTKDRGGYNIYKTQEEGTTALALLLKRYQMNGRNTVSKIITPYAPKSDGNNTQGYIQSVSKALGVSPHTPIDMNDPQVLLTLMKTIGKIEGTQGKYSDEVYMKGIQNVLGKTEKTKPLQNGENPFYCEKPSFFQRLFSKKARATAQKYNQLSSQVICEFPGGEKLTALDLGKALKEGTISLENAKLLAYAAKSSTNHSLSALNNSITELSKKLGIQGKELTATLQQTIINRGLLSSLETNSSRYSNAQDNPLKVNQNTKDMA